MFATNRTGYACKVFQAIGATGHIHRFGFLDRLAVISDFKLGQLAIAGPQNTDCSVEHASTFGAGKLRPTLKAMLGRTNRSLNFRL